MVVFLIISLLVALAAFIAVIIIHSTNLKRLKALKNKTDFALQADAIMKIEMKDQGILTQIASNFNQLIRMVQNLNESKSSLEKESGRIKALDHKIKNFEESISQSNMLVDLGMDITSSLDVDDIIRKVHEFISSSMETEEIEVMHINHDVIKFRTVDRKGNLAFYEHKDGSEKENVLQWVMDNRKEVILNDAQKDYAQYVFKPIVGLTGSRPSSLICVPLILHDKVVGAIAVSSLRKDAYKRIHFDFIRGIASYISVAFDNANVYELLDNSKKEIENEKDKSDKLLLNILPSEVAEELKVKGYAEARRFDQVSVLFSDFRNFTGISEVLTPEELVSELNIYFKAFDEIVEKHNLEKIKTIGDAYMVAGGMSDNRVVHVRETVLAGLEMQDFVIERAKQKGHSGANSFNMRVGIHTGPVVAGIVGAKKFQYDIWGDTVNTASRMESSGEVDRVNISETTYNFIKNDPAFSFEDRGDVEVKHKGEISMFFVDRK